MRVIGPSSELEAAETFVRAELESPRFRDEVLAGTRGWRIGGLFDGLPTDLEWQRIALTPEVVLEGHVRLTSYALWPEYLPEELEILLGVSESAPSWGCY